MSHWWYKNVDRGFFLVYLYQSNEPLVSVYADIHVTAHNLKRVDSGKLITGHCGRPKCGADEYGGYDSVSQRRWFSVAFAGRQHPLIPSVSYSVRQMSLSLFA